MARLGKDALVREALAVLAVNPTASMAQMSEALGVGRTTLYRHFGDRETMIAEVARLGARMFGDAFMSARPEQGTGMEAVTRICTQLFTAPDALTLMFADNPIITDEVFAEVERERATELAERPAEAANADTGAMPVATPPEEDPLEAVIRRGQGDGSISTEVPPEWAAMYIFLTVGSGHLFELSTRTGAMDPSSRAAALDLTIRAVTRTLTT